MLCLLFKWMPFHPQNIATLAMSGLEDLEQGLGHESHRMCSAGGWYVTTSLLLTKRSHIGIFVNSLQHRHRLISFSLLPLAVYAPVGLYFFYPLRELSSSLIHTLPCASFCFSSCSFPFSVFSLANPCRLIKNQTSQLQEILVIFRVVTVVYAVSSSTEGSACFSFCLTALLCLGL